ncbi:MAG: hypothetical protein AAB363_00525, partial [Planctomycetota bacterium]
MTTAVATFDSVELAQARGHLYALFANAWRYPDQDVFSSLLDMADRFVRSNAFRKLDDATACALDGVVDGIQALGRSKRSPPDQIRDRYVALFGHAVRGTCPLYELEYG